MSIFDSLGNQQAQRQQITPQQAIQQLRSNPASVLKQAGLSVPDGMSNPQQIIQHLLQSGQVPQARYQQAMQMMGRMQGLRG